MVHHLLLLAAATAIAASTLPAGAQIITQKRGTNIEGTVRGAEGAVPPLAHVFLMRYTTVSQTTDTAIVARDGSFRVTADTPGIYTLQISGVDHMSRTMRLFVPDTSTIRLDAVLAANNHPLSLDSISLVGSFNDFSFDKPMRVGRGVDGKYSVDIKSDEKEIEYQILLGTPGDPSRAEHSVNAPGSARYEYDGAGDYRSVVPVQNGVAHIVYDPKLAARSDRPGEIIFRDPESVQAFYMRMSARTEAQSNAFFEAYGEYFASKNSYEGFTFPAGKDRSELAALVDSTTDPLKRQIAMITYLSLSYTDPEVRLDTTMAERALAEIAPEAIVWEMDGEALAHCIARTGSEDYLEQVLSRHPDFDLRGSVIMSRMVFAHLSHDTAIGRRYWAVLQRDFGGSTWIQNAAAYNPDRAIQTGRLLPEFSLASLDDSTVTISNASLRGKYVLLDFWATWCGPCVMEMPSLHKAYERFRGPNFEILSFSMDVTANDVRRFRSRTFPMPWLHVFLPRQFSNPTARAFEVSGVPKPVLVGPDGVIVATESLRGAALEKTLEKYLGAGVAE